MFFKKKIDLINPIIQLKFKILVLNQANHQIKSQNYDDRYFAKRIKYYHIAKDNIYALHVNHLSSTPMGSGVSGGM